MTAAGSPLVTVFDDFADPARVADAYERLRRWPRVPHGLFRCELERVRRHQAGDPAAADAFRPYFGGLSDFLLDYLVALCEVLPGEKRAASAVVELWIGSNRTPSDLAYLHIDTHSGDHLPGPERRPVVGTIFHLGPAGGIEGGGTWFSTALPVPQDVLAHNRRMIPMSTALSLTDGWIEVGRRVNRLVRFDGRLPHFRAPMAEVGDRSAPRVAILANLWESLPELDGRMNGVSLVAPDEFAAYARLDQNDADALRRLIGVLDDDELPRAVRAFRRLYRR